MSSTDGLQTTTFTESDKYVMKMDIKALLLMAFRVLTLNNFLLLKMSFTTLRKSPEKQYSFCNQTNLYLMWVCSNGKFVK